MFPARQINAYVLCGGASRRMGTDKALLPHPEGGTLLEHAVALAAALGLEATLLSGEAGRYRHLKLRELSDARPDRGPLGGITAALTDSGSSPALILPVDLPYLKTIHLKRLRAAYFSWKPDLAVATGPGGLQPVLGLWSPSSRVRVEAALAAESRRLQDLLHELEVLLVRFSATALQNWNRPHDCRP